MAEILPILYQDQHLVAVHKPAGLLVHRSPIDRRETRFALQLLRNQLGMRLYPVHRLDKPTSGILLLALTPEAARSVARDFAAGKVEKRYLAVVRGIPSLEGVIDYPLDVPDRTGSPPRPALTLYRKLAEIELPVAVSRYPSSRYALLEAQPRSGRRHQLRRHFKHIFHPIIGDTRYGEGRHNRFFREAFGCHRLLLAATSITLTHPANGQPLTIETPPADDFAALLKTLGWHFSLAHPDEPL